MTLMTLMTLVTLVTLMTLVASKLPVGVHLLYSLIVRSLAKHVLCDTDFDRSLVLVLFSRERCPSSHHFFIVFAFKCHMSLVQGVRTQITHTTCRTFADMVQWRPSVFTGFRCTRL
jgi:hypothetical protein